MGNERQIRRESAEHRVRPAGIPGVRPGAILVALLGALLGIGLAAGCGGGADPGGERRLTVVSWGGSYERAANRAYYQPFAEERGVELGIESYNGGLAQIRTQVETGRVHWDVVDIEIFDSRRGCDEGLLERLPPDLTAPGADGSPAAEDFAEDTLTECGVGTVFYSTIYAYNDALLEGEKPAAIADFFDLERFPGRRGMRRSPLVNLEFALMADGVPKSEVYAALDTAEGLDRAFRKLDTIREQVIWWEAGAQPPQMLADGEVVMSTAYNGRIFNAQAIENQPFVIVWDGQVLDFAQLAIVAGSPNGETALDFLRFGSTAESMARVSGYIAYAPVRESGLELVATHREVGIEMLPHLPTAPDNAALALRSDWRWWSDNLDAMNERFSAWLTRQ